MFKLKINLTQKIIEKRYMADLKFNGIGWIKISGLRFNHISLLEWAGVGPLQRDAMGPDEKWHLIGMYAASGLWLITYRYRSLRGVMALVGTCDERQT